MLIGCRAFWRVPFRLSCYSIESLFTAIRARRLTVRCTSLSAAAGDMRPTAGCIIESTLEGGFPPSDQAAWCPVVLFVRRRPAFCLSAVKMLVFTHLPDVFALRGPRRIYARRLCGEYITCGPSHFRPSGGSFFPLAFLPCVLSLSAAAVRACARAAFRIQPHTHSLNQDTGTIKPKRREMIPWIPFG